MTGYTVYFGEQSFDMLPGSYMVGDKELEITIFSEGLSLDNVESVVRNKENLKLIRIYDGRANLVARFDQYTAFGRLEKNPYYLLQTYDEQGLYNPVYGEVIKIVVKKPEVIDQLNKYEATMEYIAIMADIDISEE